MEEPARKEDVPLFQTINSLVEEAMLTRGYEPPWTFVVVANDGSVFATRDMCGDSKKVLCAYRAGGSMYPLNFFLHSPGREILRATLERPGIPPKWHQTDLPQRLQ